MPNLSLEYGVENSLRLNKRLDGLIRFPFSIKLIGPRGSGKTNYMINFLNVIKDSFDHIYSITSTRNVLPYHRSNIDHLSSHMLISRSKLEQDDTTIFPSTLWIIDDMMGEIPKHILLALYTRARHYNMSFVQLEQDLYTSATVERRNVDYLVLFRGVPNRVIVTLGFDFHGKLGWDHVAEDIDQERRRLWIIDMFPSKPSKRFRRDWHLDYLGNLLNPPPVDKYEISYKTKGLFGIFSRQKTILSTDPDKYKNKRNVIINLCN